MIASAVRFTESRLLSRRRGPTVLLIAVIAFSSGAAMATAAGGRRASTSFDRFVAWSQPVDASTGGMGVGSSEEADAVLTAAADLPVVSASTRAILLGDGIRTPDGRTYLTSVHPVSIDFRTSTLGRSKLLDGRSPSPARADEAAVSFVTAELLGLHVGDSLNILFGDPAESTSSFEPVTIVGIFSYPADFPSLTGRADRSVTLTPAFAAEHPERIDWTNGAIFVQLHGNDIAAVREFRKEIADAGLPIEDITSVHEQAVGPRRVVAVEGRALWLVSAILAAAALLVIVQLTRRDAWVLSTQLRELRNLGLSNRGLMGAGALRGLRIGLLGSAGAVAVAVAASPLFPVGLARNAEPHVGVHADLVVLACGALVTVVVAVAASAGAVRAAIRHRQYTPRRAGRIAAVTSRLGPVGSTGARLAFGSATRSTDEATRPGLGNLVFTLALLIAALSLGTSFDHLLATPSLIGGTWDMTMIFENAEEHEQARLALADDPRVEAVAVGGWTSVLINGNEVYSMVLDTDQGIGLAIDRGAAPSGANEIALGATELAALRVSPGDRVTVALPHEDSEPSNPMEVIVTGRVILASPAYQSLALGQGGVLPLALFARLGGSAAEVPSLMVKLADGVPLATTYDDLTATLHPNFSFQRPDNFGVTSLTDIKKVERALVTILAILSATSFLHLMLVLTRRNRRMMATLRSLGMTAAEARRTHMVHGTLTVGAGLVVAIPIAVLAATLTWRQVAEFLGAVADPVTSATAVALTAVIAIVVGASAARVVGARQQRIPPGAVLHGE